jgi:glycosyltransferase involved in cell wall biosynthesis
MGNGTHETSGSTAGPWPVRRVLYVLHPVAIGGMETLCVDVSAELIERDIQVCAVLPEPRTFDPLAERFAAAGASVRRIDTTPRYGRTGQIRRLMRFARLLREWRPDVIHLHTGGAAGGLAVVMVARAQSDATVVITEHDAPDKHPPRYHRLGRPILDRQLHALVSVSRRNAMLRRRRLGVGTARYATILNGVPLHTPSPVERAANRERIRGQLDLAPGTLVVGSLVRLASTKGLDDLLRAFAILRGQASVDLVVVGEGPLRPELERLARQLGVHGAVHLPGFFSDATPFLDAFDVFVLAVPSGSMSIALLEAMARGLPSVITFCGPEEAIIPERTGLCAPPNDPEGLAHALARLVGDAELRAWLGINAATHVRRHFSIGRVADDLLELYSESRRGRVPARLRADAPPNAYPGCRSCAHEADHGRPCPPAPARRSSP